MKNYKEMTKCVLAARDEYVRKKKRRQIIAMRSAPVFLGLCIAAVIGTQLRDTSVKPPEPPHSVIVTETTAAVTQTAPVTAAAATTARSTAVSAAVTENSSAQTSASYTTVTVRTTAAYQTAAMTSAAAVRTTAHTTTIQTSASAATETVTQPETTPMTTLTTAATTTCTTAVTEHYSGGGAMVTGPASTPWEELPPDRKFSRMLLGMTKYEPSHFILREELIGEAIETLELTAFDDNGVIRRHNVTAYSVSGYDTSEIVAVRFADHEEYYLYNASYVKKVRLNELIEELSQKE